MNLQTRTIVAIATIAGLVSSLNIFSMGHSGAAVGHASRVKLQQVNGDNGVTIHNLDTGETIFYTRQIKHYSNNHPGQPITLILPHTRLGLQFTDARDEDDSSYFELAPHDVVGLVEMFYRFSDPTRNGRASLSLHYTDAARNKRIGVTAK